MIIPKYHRYQGDDAPEDERFMIVEKIYETRKGKPYVLTSMNFLGSSFEEAQRKVDAKWQAEKERASKREAAKVARIAARAQPASEHSGEAA